MTGFDQSPDRMGNALCIKGTRIPVRAIQEFTEDGYSVSEIIAEYPDLTRDQVEAAIAHTPTRKERPMSNPAIEVIAAERVRQVEEEGFDAAHDNEHSCGQLAKAAAVYAVPGAAAGWPWDWRCYKPKNPIADLKKAGALIAAEMERLGRVEQAAIFGRLRSYYETEEEIVGWWLLPHPQLDGRTPESLVHAGEASSVHAVIDRLDSSAYL